MDRSKLRLVIAFILLLTILGTYFVISVNFALAQLDVPVITNPTGLSLSGLKNKFRSWDTLKEFALDAVAYTAMTGFLRAATNRVIGWVQGGDGSGNESGFVDSLKNELRRSANREAGRFINTLEIGEDGQPINFCGNISKYLELAFTVPPKKTRYECTLTDIVQNVGDYYKDFTKGGWPAWISISVNAQNTPEGAFTIAADDFIAQVSRAEKDTRDSYTAGKSFLGRKRTRPLPCDLSGLAQERDAGIITPEDYRRFERELCAEEYTETPGGLIADSLSGIALSSVRRGEFADEIDEAIGAILTASVDRLLGFKFSSRSPGSTTPPEPPQEDLIGDRFIKDIDELIFTADNALGVLNQQMIDAGGRLTVAWNGRLALAESPPLDPDQLQNRLDGLNQQIATEETTIRGAVNKTKTIFRTRQDLLTSRRSLIGETSSDRIIQIIEDIPDMLSRIADAVAAVGDVPRPSSPTGQLRSDMVTMVNGTKRTLGETQTIIDATLALTETRIKVARAENRQDVVATLEEKKRSAAAEKVVIASIITTMGSHETALTRPAPKEQLENAARLALLDIIAADRRRENTTSTIIYAVTP